MPQHSNKPLRLDLYLQQLKIKCDEKYASLQREISYDNNKLIRNAIKASYKLPNNKRPDRSQNEDIIFWQIKQILTKSNMSQNEMINSMKNTIPECALWNWNETTWRAKVAKICNGNSWHCTPTQFDCFFRWCSMMQQQ